MTRLLLTLIVPFLSACAPLAMLDRIVPWWGYHEQRDLAYGTNALQRLDVYRPTTPPPTGGHPMVVFFYGGRWQGYNRREFRFVGEALANRGFLAVVPDYRQYPEVTFPAFVEDGARAVRHAVDHARDWGGNPDRLALMGHSAGAHSVAMLATDEHFLAEAGVAPGTVKAAVGMSGPYDFLPFTDDDIKALMGPSAGWPKTQPINFIDGHEPPMLLVYGLDDDIVGAHNARNMAAKIRHAGGTVEQIDYPGVDHYKMIASIAAPLRGLSPALADATRFIATHTAPR